MYRLPNELGFQHDILECFQVYTPRGGEHIEHFDHLYLPNVSAKKEPCYTLGTHLFYLDSRSQQLADPLQIGNGDPLLS